MVTGPYRGAFPPGNLWNMTWLVIVLAGLAGIGLLFPVLARRAASGLGGAKGNPLRLRNQVLAEAELFHEGSSSPDSPPWDGVNRLGPPHEWGTI